MYTSRFRQSHNRYLWIDTDILNFFLQFYICIFRIFLDCGVRIVSGPPSVSVSKERPKAFRL